MSTSDFQYTSTLTLQALAQHLHAAQKFIITTHAKPDGDAVGSCLALQRALTLLGKQCQIILMGPLEGGLAELTGPTAYELITDESNDLPDAADTDAIVIVDTGAWAQLNPMADWLRAHRAKVVVIDHHPRGDDVGAARYIDSTAGANTLILLELLTEMQATITGGEHSVAEALFLGLATDTGWFRYGNADSRVFAAAAHLLNIGLNKGRLYELTDESHQPRRLELEQRALFSLEYLLDGQIALMALTKDDFQETGGSVLDLTGMVNMPMCVGSVRAAILMTEDERGRVKLSFRSKPARLHHQDPDEGFIDVNQLAQHFGGGGHVHAAGARTDLSLAEARTKLIATLKELPARTTRSADVPVGN